MARTTIDSDTSSVSAVLFAVMGGTFRVKLNDDRGPGHRYGYVLDDEDNIIGDASDYIYGGSGFCIRTAPYSGHVPVNQIDFV